MLLDLQKNNFAPGENIIIEDKLIESAVAVLYYCLSKWIPVNLTFFSGRLNNIYAKNQQMFNEIYEVLAKVKFSDNVPVKDLLEIYTSNALRNTSVIIFTSNLDYDLYDQLHKTLNFGYDVSLVYVSPEKITGIKNNDTENILDSLPEIGINSYKIDIDDDIKEILEY
jgi:hypothetical protein